MYHRFLKLLSLGIIISLMCIFLCACGYSKEEKMRMDHIEEQGKENAADYIRNKYGFIPEIVDTEICMEIGDTDPLPWANGYVIVSMICGDKKFQVHINGEEPGLRGRDNFQQEQIRNEAEAYFRDLLGYDIYDIYLEYKEKERPDDSFPSCHVKYMLEKSYETGDFKNFMKEYSINIRIDDCENQDLTELERNKPAAVKCLQEYARESGMKAILISYKSEADYQNGYEHVYGRGGVLDFGIWDDGLYINSYASFEEEDMDACRFELQEYDGMVFCCIDREEGNDLIISKSQNKWMELEENSGNPLSEVYSINREDSGEITVYIPIERYGKSVSVFIQYFRENEWRQYECNMDVTRDKKYIFITYQGVYGGTFDFAFFNPLKNKAV